MEVTTGAVEVRRRVDVGAFRSVFAFVNSALKHLMKKVLERLMDTDVDDDDDQEEEDREQNRLRKSVHCSLTALCDWYISKTKVSHARLCSCF